MDGVINRNIQIESIEAKMASTGNMKYILKDTSNNKYFFWQKNKGQDSEAYLSFTGMGLKKGDTVAIGFTEEQKSFVNNENKTIDYTDRFILSLRESSGSPAPSQPEIPRSVANNSSQGIPQNKGNDAFGKRLAVHGFVNALISSGVKPLDITGETIVELTKLESRIDAILNPSSFRQAVQAHAPQVLEELPTIQVAPDIAEAAEQMASEDIFVEDIPF